MPAELCDLQIHVDGQQTFFVKEEIISKFSGKLRKIIKEEKRKTQMKNSAIELVDFPGGPDGFELVSRFCYGNGCIIIRVSNVCLLHCCALFLGMTEKVSSCNLLHQTETFLEGMFYWSWNDILTSIKSCETLFLYADSSGLVQKLICSLIAKIAAQNSDINNLITNSSSSSSSSPDTVKCGNFSRARWFNDMINFAPTVIEKFVKTLGAYGSQNNSLVLTKFLLHYLKSSKGFATSKSEYGGLANTAVHGVIFLMRKSAFSCRGLFSVLRVVGCFGLSTDCRGGLERLIGGLLDEATLDDLLVCGRDGGMAYDVNLVLRLVKLFFYGEKVSVQKKKTKKVGGLIDKYLIEIAPDHNLKMVKFAEVAESLPDFARDCFDEVYRAVDIYLESHPSHSFEERSRLCRCLNYEKLSLEACKDLAKNPRIPPRIAVKALASRHPNIINICTKDQFDNYAYHESPIRRSNCNRTNQMMVVYKGIDEEESCSESEGEDMIRLNLQRMQWRVVELEKACREMKGHMSRMVNARVITPPTYLNTTLPRMC